MVNLFLGFLWLFVAFLNGYVAVETENNTFWIVVVLNLICSGLNFAIAAMKVAG